MYHSNSIVPDSVLAAILYFKHLSVVLVNSLGNCMYKYTCVSCGSLTNNLIGTQSIPIPPYLDTLYVN